MKFSEYFDGSLLMALAGSIISSILARDPKQPKWQSILGIFLGTLISIFLTPFVIDYFQLPDKQSYSNGISFLIGLLGLNLSISLLDAVKRFDFLDLFKRFLGRGGNQK